MITVKGSLLHGLVVDGVRHLEFEMRPVTIRETIGMVESGASELSGSMQSIHRAAVQLLRIGEVTEITVDMLLDLPDVDLEPLFAAQDELEKKLKGPSSS